MHDFIQNLSFSTVPFESSRDRQIAGPSRLTTAAPSEPLRRLTQSFNEVPAYRPSPMTRPQGLRASRKSAPITNNS